MPPLSIVIPSHNRADLLRVCLTSVRQNAPPDTEVIVVDDGSPGGSVSATAGDFSGVRVLRLDQQSGFCVAANTGVRSATSPIVEVLNDDTQVTPDWAEAALTAFARPHVAAVAPLVLQGEPGTVAPRIDSAGDRYFIGGIAGKREHGGLLDSNHLRAGHVFGASGAAAFYRRDVFISVGGFPEDFGAYFDDVDLSFRLHRAGWRVWYEPASRVWHRVSASHGRTCPRLLAQQSRNEERVFWRNLPAGSLGRALPWHVAVLLAKAWRRWRRGGLLPFLRGRFAALAELPELLRHRRQLAVPGSVDVGMWELDERYWGEISPVKISRRRSAQLDLKVG